MKNMRFALRSEDDDHLRISSCRAQPCEIAVAVEHNPVKPAIKVPVIPVFDPAFGIGLSICDRGPSAAIGARQAGMDACGEFAVCAVQYLREYSHSTPA